jgi:6-phosphogluconolactonase
MIRCDSPAHLAGEAARRFLDWARPAANEPTPRAVALSGGRIAGPFFDALVKLDQADPGPRLAKLPVHFFFADERCVPPDHADSNFALARARLFVPLGLPATQVHRLRGELDPSLAAVEAERELRAVTTAPADALPSLDLVILGMGEDGHVASLFPGAPAAVTESRAAYAPVVGPKPPPQRLTLTFAALAAARALGVRVSGDGKAAALAESLRPAGATPLARVLRASPRALVFTDFPAP